MGKKGLSEVLNILMINHHRRFKHKNRSHGIVKHLVQRGHKVSLILIADHRKIGIAESELNGVRIIETPDLLWGRLRSGWDLWNLLNRMVYLSRDKGPYDLVYCFETRPATIYPALFYCKRHNLPLVTDCNDGHLAADHGERGYVNLHQADCVNSPSGDGAAPIPIGCADSSVLARPKRPGSVTSRRQNTARNGEALWAKAD